MDTLSIRKKIKALENKLIEASFQFRIMILLLSLLVIYGIWFVFMAIPLQQRINLSVNQIKRTKANLEQIEKKILALSTAVVSPTDTEEFKKLAKEQEKRTLLDKEFAKYQPNLSSPEEVIIALRKKIEKQEGLTLMSIQKQPPRTIFQSHGQAIVFHGIQAEFKATYHSTVAFLQAVSLERLPVFWDELYYRVEKYPNATVRINLHTVSYEKIADETA